MATLRPPAPRTHAAFTARVAFTALVASTLCASTVHASESYPAAIERALGTPCAPDCTTCHTRPSGGALTANTPVGISVRRAGLECCSTSQLLDVLGALETNETDSDADGTPDVEELRAGTNPNALEGKLECYVPPAPEGCSLARCSSSSARGAVSPFGALLALAGISLLRRRARRHSQ